MSSLSESIETILNERRSVRAFLPKPLDGELLRRIFRLSQRAPSNCNTQPWVTHVVSGDPLDQLRRKMTENAKAGKFEMDFHYEAKYQGVYRERQFDAANQMYGALQIPREDKARRAEVFLKNYSFFGAPHVAFLFLPEEFGLREAADVGMYAQSLMLTLTAHGVGSCPQTSLSFHAGVVREVLDIDPSNKLLFGISFGYEDKENPINDARVGRAPLEDATVFHG